MQARRLLVTALIAAAAMPLSAIAAISENFDGVTAPALPDGWSVTQSGDPSDIPWATRAVGYANSAPNALWVDDVDDYADIAVVSPTYQLPATGGASVTFHHSYALWAPDAGALDNGVFNGAVLEISINGAAFQDLVAAGGSFSQGGYDSALDPGFDNPLAQPPSLNRSVWGRTSAGFVTSTATLPASAAGATIAFRWRLGTEGGGRGYDTHSGWWIDDFSCDSCQLAPNDTIFKDGFDPRP